MAKFGAIVAGILYGTRKKIENVLKEKGAIDEKAAIDPKEAEINFEHVLELMEKGGLIGKTPEGKVYLKEKR